MLKAILKWLWLMPEPKKRAGDITLYGKIVLYIVQVVIGKPLFIPAVQSRQDLIQLQRYIRLPGLYPGVHTIRHKLSGKHGCGP